MAVLRALFYTGMAALSALDVFTDFERLIVYYENDDTVGYAYVSAYVLIIAAVANAALGFRDSCWSRARGWLGRHSCCACFFGLLLSPVLLVVGVPISLLAPAFASARAAGVALGLKWCRPRAGTDGGSDAGDGSECEKGGDGAAPSDTIIAKEFHRDPSRLLEVLVEAVPQGMIQMMVMSTARSSDQRESNDTLGLVSLFLTMTTVAKASRWLVLRPLTRSPGYFAVVLLYAADAFLLFYWIGIMWPSLIGDGSAGLVGILTYLKFMIVILFSLYWMCDCSGCDKSVPGLVSRMQTPFVAVFVMTSTWYMPAGYAAHRFFRNGHDRFGTVADGRRVTEEEERLEEIIPKIDELVGDIADRNKFWPVTVFAFQLFTSALLPLWVALEVGSVANKQSFDNLDLPAVQMAEVLYIGTLGLAIVLAVVQAIMNCAGCDPPEWDVERCLDRGGGDDESAPTATADVVVANPIADAPVSSADGASSGTSTGSGSGSGSRSAKARRRASRANGAGQAGSGDAGAAVELRPVRRGATQASPLTSSKPSSPSPSSTSSKATSLHASTATPAADAAARPQLPSRRPSARGRLVEGVRGKSETAPTRSATSAPANGAQPPPVPRLPARRSSTGASAAATSPRRPAPRSPAVATATPMSL